MKNISAYLKINVGLSCLILAAPAVFSAQDYLFKNLAPININDIAPASPYPSAITVSGLVGKTISKLTVTLNGFSHTFPADVDILLVGPTGTNIVLLSDAGSGIAAGGLSLTFDDNATRSATTSALTSGTYKPTNIGAGDIFPAPAPATSLATNLSAFNGTDPNGTWSLYIVDDLGSDVGCISGGWSLTMTLAGVGFVTQPGELIISEFRLRGPNAANDEFVEIYNTNDVDHTVYSVDGSAGYALAASDGIVRFVIPNGTVIPAHGHFLGVNSSGYSLSGYAAGDVSFTTDIPDNAGIALFRTALPGSFTVANRLDAVGSTSEANTLYKEGAGYPALTPFSIDSSFYRNITNTAPNNLPRDTGNNALDFLFVDSNGTSAGAGQRLGVAGPENLASPISLPGGPPLARTLLDSGATLAAVPNRVRDFTSVPANNSTFGSLTLRRQFINRTGKDITRLRFRITEIATFPSPSGIADLRPISSADSTVTIAGSNINVFGAKLEQPPSSPNGGGFNSTFAITNITAANPLTNGASVNVQFVCGIQQTGTYKIGLLPETLPAAASDLWFTTGNTESNIDLDATVRPVITNFNTAVARDIKVRFTTTPGRLYQVEHLTNLASLGTWTTTDGPYAGTGYPLEATHLNGKGSTNQFYRVRVVP